MFHADEQFATPSFVAVGAVGGTPERRANAALPLSLSSPAYGEQSPYFERPAATRGVVGGAGGRSPASPPPRGSPGIRGARGVSGSPRSCSVSVFERLSRDAEEQRERRDAAREDILRREQSHCRVVPKISAMGHNIPRDTDIVVRLENVSREKRALEEYKRAGLERENNAVLEKWFKPTISRKGRRAESRVYNDEMRQLRVAELDRRGEELRHARIEKEMEDTYGSPAINPKSERIAYRTQSRDGLGGMSHIEAMMERDRIAQLARWERHAEQEAELKERASPTITAYAASRRPAGSAVERLWQDSQARAQRQVQLERERMEREEHAGLLQSPARNSSHIPRSTNPSRGVQHEDPGVDMADARNLAFLARHEAYTRRREDNLRQLVEEEAKTLHTPHINPVSELIASRLPLSSLERLTAPKREFTPVADGSPPRPPAGLSAVGGVAPATPPRLPPRDEFSYGGDDRWAARPMSPVSGRTSTVHEQTRGVGLGSSGQRGRHGSVGSAHSASRSLTEVSEALSNSGRRRSSAAAQRQGELYQRMNQWLQKKEQKLQQLRSDLQREESGVEEVERVASVRPPRHTPGRRDDARPSTYTSPTGWIDPRTVPSEHWVDAAGEPVDPNKVLPAEPHTPRGLTVARDPSGTPYALPTTAVA